jgi:integrase
VSRYRADADRVFCHPETGSFYDRSKLGKRYRNALLAGNVGPTEEKVSSDGGRRYTKPVLTFHSLRHSYGTALAMGGIKAIQIKHLMGHSSLSMTDKYMHFAPDLDEAERIGSVFAALREAV